MRFRKPSALAPAAMAVLALLLLVACGDADAEPGLTRAEVEEIVRAELADARALSQPGPGLTPAEVERIARRVVTSIPLKSDPAEYTRFFVDAAIARYETQGLEATLAHYSHKESIDGQWYVFIIGEDDRLIAHPNPYRLGLDLRGWVGTRRQRLQLWAGDAVGDGRGEVGCPTSTGTRRAAASDPTTPGRLSTNTSGRCGTTGLLFASGWYIPADEYTRFVVDEAIARYQAEGLEETLAYYSSLESVDGQWYVFVATPEGEIVGHYNADGLAVHVQEMLDDGSFGAAEDGVWVNHEDVNPATGEVEDKHFWLVEHDGLVFGSGWHHDASG